MSTSTPPDERIASLLALIEMTWGYRSLRPLQLPAMQAMLEGRDSVVVLPTGGGKSLCYQAPALYLSQIGQGPTVVISPLIALMKDQVDSLRSLGVPAAQLDSSLSPDERREILQELRDGSLHMLYLSPEKLVGGGNAFREFLRDAGVKTIAIDEAHCISHWGHDFRPEYRQLENLKQMFPGASIHAFTATATEQVRSDIAAQLNLENPEILVGNFDRPNLTYRILPRRDMFEQIHELLERHKDEAGIIYCLRRKDVDEVAATLNASKKFGRKAVPYHAGMTPVQRKKAQEAFIDEECDLIVATIAFGMGIDRSNIRFVLHTGMPKSIEAYQQETGRAGRDGLPAECVLLHSGQDPMTWKSIIEKSAREAEAAGVQLSEDFVRTAQKHIDDMDRFARSATCRHASLVEYFGQKYELPNSMKPGSCEACDHCLGDTQTLADAGVIAQKILSAIARTDQRFGVGHIIAVLRGENTERIRQLRHDELSTYGLLKEYSKPELRDFIYQLISQGALTTENLVLSTGHSAPIIKFNALSVKVLKGLHPVRLVQIAHKEEAKPTRGGDTSWEGVDHGLFETLRGLRKQIAGERSIPPYVIFSDATLRELAKLRPTNMQNFRLIYGIGERKLNDLGPLFLPVITDFCRSHNLPTDLTFIASSPPPSKPITVRVNSSKDQAFAMFRQGASIDDVSQQLTLARSTISGYLADYVTLERPVSIAPWISDATYKRVHDVVRQVGSSRLKPIFIALNESIPYDEIRLVLSHINGR